jgi:hypothetical protein
VDRGNEGRRDYCTEIIVEPFFGKTPLPSSGFGDLFGRAMVKRVRKKLNQRKGDTKQYPAAWAATTRHIGMRVVTGGMVSRRRVPASVGKPRPGNLAGDVPEDAQVLLQGCAKSMGILDAETGEVVVMRAFLPSNSSSAVTRLVASRFGGDFCALARWLRGLRTNLPRLDRDSVALPEHPGETVIIGPQSNRFNMTHYGRRVLPSKAFTELEKRNGGADLGLYVELVAAIEEDTVALVGAKELAANKSAVKKLGHAHCLGKKTRLSFFGQTEIIVNAGFVPHRDEGCADGSFTSVLALYEGSVSVQGGS